MVILVVVIDELGATSLGRVGGHMWFYNYDLGLKNFWPRPQNRILSTFLTTSPVIFNCMVVLRGEGGELNFAMLFSPALSRYH